MGILQIFYLVRVVQHQLLPVRQSAMASPDEQAMAADLAGFAAGGGTIMVEFMDNKN